MIILLVLFVLWIQGLQYVFIISPVIEHYHSNYASCAVVSLLKSLSLLIRLAMMLKSSKSWS